MDKIVLTEEKETLLIPLYGKAHENSKKRPILSDKKAAEIVSQIDYDFSSLKIPEKTNLMMCLRAKLIDNFVKDFLAKNKNSAALHLGCGLDSRYNRIENDDVDWYDVDFKEVIDIRKHFYSESDSYHMISSSVTEPEWLEKIPSEKKHALVIAEGLFMYLQEDEIKALIKNIRDRFGSFTMIFDAFSVFAAQKVRNHPSIRKTGATTHWGIDNPHELEEWNTEIKLLKELYFTSNEEIDHLDLGAKMMFKIADLFSVAKNAHRILIYNVE